MNNKTYKQKYTFGLFQVSDWSAGGSEALPESPSYSVYGVLEYFTLLPDDATNFGCLDQFVMKITRAFRFALLMGLLLFLEAVSLYGQHHHPLLS